MLNEAEPAKRAPEPLRLVQQFLNSVEYDGGAIEEEDLTDTKALRRWLRDRELISAQAKVTDADLRHAIEVREGPPRPARRERRRPGLARLGARGSTRRRADAACARPSRRGEPPRLEANCSDVDGGIARLLAIVATAAADGTWERLKACADDGCRWAFYDHSKNRSGPVVLDGVVREPEQGARVPRSDIRAQGLQGSDVRPGVEKAGDRKSPLLAGGPDKPRLTGKAASGLLATGRCTGPAEDGKRSPGNCIRPLSNYCT